MQTEIYHLFHSGTAVRKGDKLFVFDYFKDELQNEKALSSSLENGVIRKDSFKGINEAFVFISHSHHDHYNSVVFEWEKYCKNIKYIAAAEVKEEKDLPNKDNLYFMEQDQKINLAEIEIESLGSTDKGVSFLVKSENLSIFHAGDLNWWKWKKFSAKVQKREGREYRREVNKLKGRKIDIAFVPVDPRLEEHYYLAGEYFINQIKPALFIAIHFGDNYDITRFFKDRFNSDQTRTVEITKRGEKIIYNKIK